MKNKYLYIETFGCQMNVHDSEQMVVLLNDIGYKQTDDFRKADLILINTCSIREIAEQKAFSVLGQNVNSYGNQLSHGCNFVSLNKKINEINGIERIRFTASHPKDLSDDLIDCFASVSKLCEYIHLPVQSGSNRNLNLMNRGYTVEDYMTKVDRLRDACPKISITSDIIVGFPGETHKE